MPALRLTSAAAAVTAATHRLGASGGTAAANVCSTHAHMSYGQAISVGLLQGVTEPFPVSSLGHSVLVPAWLGWHNLVCAQSASESFYLAFIVGLHVATALGLMAYFWRDWVRIIGAFFTSIARRRIETPTQRLAWLLVVATIPAGITGLLLEHILRTQFAKPLSAAIFLTINGFILFGGERLRRLSATRALAERKGEARDTDDILLTGGHGREARVRAAGAGPATTVAGDGPATVGRDDGRRSDRGPRRRLDTMAFPEAGFVGLAQMLALLAGISRSGITMVAGLARGLDHEDAARFSFLLATPIILAAGVLKIGDLTGPLGAGNRPQILVGSACALVLAMAAVAFLLRWFRSQTLWPFGVYCVVFGLISIVRFA